MVRCRRNRFSARHSNIDDHTCHEDDQAFAGLAVHAAVAADYAARWQELVAPTLAECESFCNSVIPEPDPLESQI